MERQSLLKNAMLFDKENSAKWGGGRVTAQEFWLKDAIANALVARCGH